jgi:hypothetical protein
MISSYAAMTRSRTATSVSRAASLSATAVTTSTMSALPLAAAIACTSAALPDWATPFTAPCRSEEKSRPVPLGAAGGFVAPLKSPWVAA